MTETDVSRVGNMEQQINKLIATIVLVADGVGDLLVAVQGLCSFYCQGRTEGSRIPSKRAADEQWVRDTREVNLKAGALRRRFCRCAVVSFDRPSRNRIKAGHSFLNGSETGL